MIKNDDIQSRLFTTPRLNIRAFQPGDAANIYEYLSNPEVYRFEPGEPSDPHGAQDLAIEFSTSAAFWAVELRESQKVIGQIYFGQIEPPNLMTWELGYIINPSYQRQGYATEAVLALLHYGFISCGTHRVFAHCNPDNVRSWRLLERVGFRREGLMKKEIFFRRSVSGDPLWTDTLIYALLEEEYLFLNPL